MPPFLRALLPTLLLATDPALPQDAGGPPPEVEGAEVDGAEEAEDGHERMIALLQRVAEESDRESFYLGTALHERLERELAELPADAPERERMLLEQSLGLEKLRLGQNERAIELFEAALGRTRNLPRSERRVRRAEISYNLGVACMRWGETQNCVARHTARSCLLPIGGDGVHADQRGSRRAMEAFARVHRLAPEGTPVADAALWLYNVAAMTAGEWPDEVPEGLRLPEEIFSPAPGFPRFPDVAPELGLATFNLSGGAAASDFDGDGDFDLVTSTWDVRGPMRYFENARSPRFRERTEEAGLARHTGGLNLNHADYDGDGDSDVLVLRGAWLGAAGRHPNSLLANDGEAVFRDVTFDAGLGEVHYPTQAADWADVDLDGDLDLFVGNESRPDLPFPSQLFRNDGDGTFTDVALEAGVTNLRFAKGVSFGDYDDDGDPDLYVSNLQSANRLYRNEGDGTFVDVAPQLGVTGPRDSFPAWFWDFDNDGHLDVFVASYYEAGIPERLAAFVRSATGRPAGAGTPSPERPAELSALYRGDGEGGFEDVAARRGLDRLALTMGANFGDLDNDGFLDFYLGTGYPFFDGLMPNVMMRSDRGERFVDVTTAGGFGHAQKGHAVVFCDLDGDGDQDVFEQMGGAYPGDAFGDVLFENPGFGNAWIGVELAGVRSNRQGIGARLRVDFEEEGERRSVHREMGTGGSFGSNPAALHVGLGRAEVVQRITVSWPVSGLQQVLEDVPANRHVRITEGKDGFELVERPSVPLR